MNELDLYQHYLNVGMSFVVEKKILNYKMNDLDNEFCSIFSDSMKIYNSFDKMSLICSLINKIPSKDFFDEREIYEDDYLKYHIENYLVCSISMLDKLSKLLNNVLSLRIKDKDCSFVKLINKHGESLPKEIFELLHELKLETKNLRSYRNHVVHEGEFYDEEWFMLSGLSFLSRRSDLFVNEKQLFNEAEKEYKKYTSIFKEQNEVISNSVLKILNIISPVIKEKADKTINSTPQNELVHICSEVGVKKTGKY